MSAGLVYAGQRLDIFAAVILTRHFLEEFQQAKGGRLVRGITEVPREKITVARQLFRFRTFQSFKSHRPVPKIALFTRALEERVHPAVAGVGRNARARRQYLLLPTLQELNEIAAEVKQNPVTSRALFLRRLTSSKSFNCASVNR
jgi:hypothetical protein